MVDSNPYQAPNTTAEPSKASRFFRRQFWVSNAILCFVIFRAWQRVNSDLGRFGEVSGASIAYCLFAGAWSCYWVYRHFVRPRLLHRKHHSYLHQQFDLAMDLLTDQKLEEAVSLLDTAVWCERCQAWVPNSIELRSRIHCLLGNYRQATDDTILLYEMNPSEIDYVEQLAALLAGAPDDTVRDLDQAHELAKYGLSIDGDHEHKFLRIQAAIHGKPVSRFTVPFGLNSGYQ